MWQNAIKLIIEMISSNFPMLISLSFKNANSGETLFYLFESSDFELPS